MTTHVLISFFSNDRPGVIEELSAAIEDAGGNWLESQLSRLGGRFAGVLRASCPRERQSELHAALEGLAANGITATVTDAGQQPIGSHGVRNLSLLGPDRPGIVHELTRALHAAGFNVLQLETGVETAAMSGEPLFRACARIELLEESRLDELEWQLEAMAEHMTLEIDLHETS